MKESDWLLKLEAGYPKKLVERKEKLVKVKALFEQLPTLRAGNTNDDLLEYLKPGRTELDFMLEF